MSAMRPGMTLPVMEGPELLVGTTDPRTTRHAGGWADGMAVATLDLDTAGIATLFDVARDDAWAQAGRAAPRPTSSFWSAPGDRDVARQQLLRHLRHYLNRLPTDLVGAMAPTTGFAGPASELRALLRRSADLGADEVHLIPTSTDLAQLEQAAELVS